MVQAACLLAFRAGEPPAPREKSVLASYRSPLHILHLLRIMQLRFNSNLALSLLEGGSAMPAQADDVFEPKALTPDQASVAGEASRKLVPLAKLPKISL